MNQPKTKHLKIIAMICLIATLTGCAAATTAIKKRNLEVETKMSDTIFLDPVSIEQQVIYVQLRNTSDKQNLTIKSLIEQKLTARGYTVTNDLNKAHYLLQANILKVGKTDPRESQGLLASGYGGAISGATLGVLAAASVSNSSQDLAGLGLLGGIAGLAADAMVEDVMYSIVTDLQISERAEEGVSVTESNTASLKQGNSGAKQVSSTKKTNWHRYQTRIVSTANQVNLEFDEAVPTLETGLSQAISGLF